jgi:hypothetical protein
MQLGGPVGGHIDMIVCLPCDCVDCAVWAVIIGGYRNDKEHHMKKNVNGTLFAIKSATISTAVAATIAAGALTGLLTMQSAYAQDEGASLPLATTTGNVSYLSGGIGIDESTAMKQAASKYSLELVFSAKAGAAAAYLADVHVKVSDRSGKAVIDTVANGPYLLANLPNGNYRVEAISKDVTKTANVTVTKGSHKRVVFSWSEE